MTAPRLVVLPPLLAGMPVAPVSVVGPGWGLSRLNKKPIELAYARHPGMVHPTSVYVAPWGSNSNSGLTLDQPWTANKALRVANCTRIGFLPGVYDPSLGQLDIRITDPNQNGGAGQLKHLYAVCGKGTVTLRVPGPNLSTLNWTVEYPATWPYIYTAVLSPAIPGGGSARLQRVLRTDLRDEVGREVTLREFTVSDYGNNSAALNALQSLGTGWAMWNAGYYVKVYISCGGMDIQAHRAQFRGLYTDAANGARVLNFGGFVALENIDFDGVGYDVLDNGPTQRPESFDEDCDFAYSNGNGINEYGSTVLFGYRRTAHKPVADCFNYNQVISDPLAPLGHIVEWDCDGTCPGDVDYLGTGLSGTYATTVTQNRNVSSSHAPHVLRLGVEGRKSWGPLIVDTSTTMPAGTMNLCCNVDAPTSVNGAGIAIYGRTGWTGRCHVGAATPVSLRVSDGGVMKLWDNELETPTLIDGIGSFETFEPDAP